MPSTGMRRGMPEQVESNQHRRGAHEPPDLLSLARVPPLLPPSYMNNPVSRLLENIVLPQAHLLSHGYGGQAPVDPARALVLAHLSAAARVQLETNSLENNRGKRPLQVQEEGEKGKKGKRKNKRRKTKGKQAERWDQMFERLVQFKNLYGHCLVPNRYPDDPSLGAWVSTQRRHYKILTSGDPDTTTPMTEERASRLQSIGFSWSTTDPRHVPWETRFKELLEYKAEHGTFLYVD